MGRRYPAGALARLQQEQMKLLELVALVCDEFGLTWFADSGTCLGAARHGGFIPWDDDVDIALPLDDYQMFCRVAPEVLPEGYGLYVPEREENYPPLFAKLYKRGTRYVSAQMAEAGFDQGIFVDVFAYCALDGDPRTARRQVHEAAFWQRVSYLYHISHPKVPASANMKFMLGGALAASHGIVRRLYSPESIKRHFDAVFERGDGAGRWTNMFYSEWGTFDEKVLFPTTTLPFGPLEVPVPADYDAYLTELYGAWREFPPAAERDPVPPVILDFGDGVNVMEGAGM